MAGKNKKSSDRFNNPFSGLKGLSVSSQQKSAAPDETNLRPVDPDPIASPADQVLNPDDQFAEAMGALGVQKTRQDDILEKSVPARPPVGSRDEPSPSQSAVTIPGGSRRQERKIARRMGAAEATLDLHGVTAAEVTRKLEWFLENAIFHGFRFVRIVTGKGAHSQSGPVLRPLVEQYLAGIGRQYVSAWVKAPNNQGGEGALLVELRQKEME